MTVNIHKLIEEALVGEELVFNKTPIVSVAFADNPNGLPYIQVACNSSKPSIINFISKYAIDQDIELIDLPPFNLKKTLDDLLIDETLKNAGKITKWTIRTCTYIDINVCSSTMSGSTRYKINDDIELAD